LFAIGRISAGTIQFAQSSRFGHWGQIDRENVDAKYAGAAKRFMLAVQSKGNTYGKA
jgi:hypothetical protein